ncbi:MAG: hypothetical protein UV38_C0002G0150 [candidate division TM6 bacterium GW2011_GWE2_42_60]|nr:MAG: hypothetical protein UV38_C0002G0150 [candidate division TM6 bacterium GW2011_GWE2_42_60]HBY06093.1 thioredoxin-disulfide reductase [Candidatus Dependentiae bacterium]
MTKEKLIILGSGPAGLTAAIYAARSGLGPLVIEGSIPGGQLMGTSFVENWPGETRIPGPDLMQQIRLHAEARGARIISGTVATIKPLENAFQLTLTSRKEFISQSVIIATGAIPRRLNCPGEDIYWGKGVSTCSTCDGTFFTNKKVYVVGGGDSALENALFLTQFTPQVSIIHARDTLSATDENLLKKVLGHPQIVVHYKTAVSAIKGDGERVTSVILTNLKDQSTSTHQLDGLFLAIGHVPNTDFLQGIVTLSDSKHIVVSQGTNTSIPGIFAAGDVVDFRYRQAITAAAEGCKAALDSYNYLKNSTLPLN